MFEYTVVRSTRIENNILCEGWIVERSGEGGHVHVSVLFKNREDASNEAARLTASDKASND